MPASTLIRPPRALDKQEEGNAMATTSDAWDSRLTRIKGIAERLSRSKPKITRRTRSSVNGPSRPADTPPTPRRQSTKRNGD